MLKDGVCLFGPLKDKPGPNLGIYVEVNISGRSWFVVYATKNTDKTLTAQQVAEIQKWAETNVSKLAR